MGWLGKLFGKGTKGDEAVGGGVMPVPAPPEAPIAVAAPEPAGDVVEMAASEPVVEVPAAEVVAAFTALALPGVRLDLVPGVPVPEAAVSSLGGRPSLPADLDWPEEGGVPMLFLAQVNYADMPPLDGFPASGLLSVFVADDATHGCAFPSVNGQGFRCFYFEDPAALVRRAAPAAPVSDDVLSSALRAEGVTLTGQAFDALPGLVTREAEAALKTLEDAGVTVDEGALEDWLQSGGQVALAYGGYPSFAQGDVRAGQYRFYARPLLVVASFTEGALSAAWGDMGAGNFLMKPKDMEPLHANRALYYYDSY